MLQGWIEVVVIFGLALDGSRTFLSESHIELLVKQIIYYWLGNSSIRSKSHTIELRCSAFISVFLHTSHIHFPSPFYACLNEMNDSV